MYNELYDMFLTVKIKQSKYIDLLHDCKYYNMNSDWFNDNLNKLSTCCSAILEYIAYIDTGNSSEIKEIAKLKFEMYYRQLEKF